MKRKINRILTQEDVDNFLNGEKGSHDTIDSNNYSRLPYKTEKELNPTEFSIGSFIISIYSKLFAKTFCRTKLIFSL